MGHERSAVIGHWSGLVAERNKSSGRRGNLAALVTVAILALVLLWIAHAVVAHNQLQDCVDSGRRNCLPVPDGGNG